jgi:hypothetical protein
MHHTLVHSTHTLHNLLAAVPLAMELLLLFAQFLISSSFSWNSSFLHIGDFVFAISPTSTSTPIILSIWLEHVDFLTGISGSLTRQKKVAKSGVMVQFLETQAAYPGEEDKELAKGLFAGMFVVRIHTLPSV